MLLPAVVLILEDLRTGGQKPGFYAFLRAVTRLLCKNPVSLVLMRKFRSR